MNILSVAIVLNLISADPATKQDKDVDLVQGMSTSLRINFSKDYSEKIYKALIVDEMITEPVHGPSSKIKHLTTAQNGFVIHCERKNPEQGKEEIACYSSVDLFAKDIHIEIQQDRSELTVNFATPKELIADPNKANGKTNAELFFDSIDSGIAGASETGTKAKFLGAPYLKGRWNLTCVQSQDPRFKPYECLAQIQLKEVPKIIEIPAKTQ